ncbi:MAG TPA: heat-inducible transcriptional repressor HrcA [Microthrixaceae bacterium]|nr:heat-inducible transcriptional repressor HrcA [Microthrixaceae bacterium]
MLDDRELDHRKAAILRAVVQQYIETAQPVGSSTVSARSDVAVSSATVRNDMTILEHEGYLLQPHTSAGRIPTEKGYRYFVDTLSGSEPLSPTNVRMVKDFFSTAHGELEQMLAETSSLLSNVTGTAAVVVGEATDVSTFRSIQLVDLSATTILAVAVLSNGVVLKRTIEFGAGDVAVMDGAENLAEGQAYLSELVIGQPLSELASAAPDLLAPGGELAALALDALREAAEVESQQVFVEGRARIAGSFDARETIEAVLGILEQQFVVVSLLKELVDGGVAVSIGSESGVAHLAECSLVVAPYRLGGESAGAIAVLGPTRMNYPETLSAVAVVSQRLSSLLSEG